MSKKIEIVVLWLFLWTLACAAFGQNPQTQTAPIYAVNAKYANGVAPGYAPTFGSGLNVLIGPGTANCSGSIVTYTGGSLTLTASTTNYVYLNTSASCVPAVKTTSFTSSDIPLATIATGSSTISGILDDRTFFTTGNGGSSGVSAIVPGSNVNCSPIVSGQCIGTVTLSATGGGGGLPSSTAYIMAGYSGLYDDNHSLSSGVTAAAWSCNGTTCTVNTTGAHNLVAGNYVDVCSLSGWFGPQTGYSGCQIPGIGSFKILSAGLTSTAFEFNYSLNSGSGTGGTIYNAGYWGFYQIAVQPFINGHGTLYGIETSMQTLATNLTTLLGGPINCAIGTPTHLIVYGGQNDIQAGSTASQIEGWYQSIWTYAHAHGCIVDQGSIVSAAYGLGLPASATFTQATINLWLTQQAKSFSNTASGAYWDSFIDYASYLNDRSTITLGEDADAAAIFGARTNLWAAGLGATSAVGPFPLYQEINDDSGLAFNNFVPWIFYGPSDSSGSAWMKWIPDQDMQIFQENVNLQAWQLLQTSTAYSCPGAVGNADSPGNALLFCFNDSVSPSFASLLIYPSGSLAGSEQIKFFSDGSMAFPQLPAPSGTAFLCVSATTGKLTLTCPGGGTLDANTVNTPQYATGGGTANAQTVTLSPTITSLSNGMHVRWKPSVNNTGAMTLTVNGTTVSVTKCGTATLTSGDVVAGTVADATYDGTELQLAEPQATGCASSSSGVTSATAIAPLRANGASGSPQTGAVNFDCPSCASGGSGNYVNLASAITCTPSGGSSPACTLTNGAFIVTGNPTSLSITGIGSYNQLQVFWAGTQSGGAGEMNVALNGDTNGSNYAASGAGGAGSFGCDLLCGGFSGGAGAAGQFVITGLNDATNLKSEVGSNFTPSVSQIQTSGSWNGTATVTNFQMSWHNTGAFSTNFKFSIYGLN
jgi:hypothetical protein